MNEPMRQFLNFLAVAEFAQTVLLVFILFVMNKNKKANLFFSGFIIILSLNFFTIYLFNLNLKTATLISAIISLPGISLTGVFIYFYVLFMTGIIEKIEWKHAIHLIVYLADFLFSASMAYRLKELPPESALIRQTVFIIFTIGFINSISYIIYTIFILKKYYRKIENYYSDLERMSFRWLLKITMLSFTILTFWCVDFWFSHLGTMPKSPMGLALNIILLIIIIFITSYYLINQPEIFKRNVEMNHEIEDPDNPPGAEKYARQSIDDEMQDEYLVKLNTFMNDHKPYLDENITIKDLAEGVKIPSHHLSIVINNRLNKNFYTFINEYRIKEAAAILDDPENFEASIIAIAFRSGFNSKSTFNSVFKKIMGQTPSEYRNRNILRSELAS